MAERVDNMYQLIGSLDQQLDEVHRSVQNLTITSPNTQAPPVPVRNPARSPTAEMPDPLSPKLAPSSPPNSPPRHQNTKFYLPRAAGRPRSPEPSSSAPSNAHSPPPSSPTETTSTSRASSPTQKRVSEFSFGGSSLRYSSSSYASSDAGASSVGWQSPVPLLSESSLRRQQSTSTKKTSPLPRTPEVREPGERSDNRNLSLLPPPAMGLAAPYELERTTSYSTSHTSHGKLSPYPAAQPDIMMLHRSSTTASQKAAFEKEAFRNSAILCDV
jgi:hypothetical protein